VVIGVAPEGFASSVFGWKPAAWVPLANVRELTGVPLADWRGSLYTIARLKPGIDARAAAAELDGPGGTAHSIRLHALRALQLSSAPRGRRRS
jgi:hypothetical protein